MKKYLTRLLPTNIPVTEPMPSNWNVYATVDGVDYWCKLFICLDDIPVGQVSEGAVWLTSEPAEFDEEDLVFYYKHRSFSDQNFTSPEPFLAEDWWEKGVKEKYTCIVKLKCPTCKTFH